MRQHRDRLLVKHTAADEVEADAILVLPSKRPPLPRPNFARTSRLLQHRDPASPPHLGATGVASQLRGVGGAQSCAMAEEVRGAKRQSGVLDEGDASGSGGAGLSQPAEKTRGIRALPGPARRGKAANSPLAVITRRQGTHAWCMGCRWFRCDNA